MRLRWNGPSSERGDAGLPILLITPFLLVIVFQLVSATQLLFERREAYSVAHATARATNRADPGAVRAESRAVLDPAASEAAGQAFIASEGYTGTVTYDLEGDLFVVTVEVEKGVDYIFPNVGLPASIGGEATAEVLAGISDAGS